MTPILRSALLAALLAGGAILPGAETKTALDEQAVAAFKDAFANQDASAKKAAVQALANPAAGDNSDVIPLLMERVDDRQASEVVMAALRSRTGVGLTMDSPVNGSAENPKRAHEWRSWFTAWKEKEKAKAAIAKLQEKVDPPKPAPVASEPAGTSGQGGGDAAAPRAVPDDLGKPVRIFFQRGGSKLYYVISRRIDADGNLVSLRVAHPEGGGEETLAADLIARVEEDAE